MKVKKNLRNNTCRAAELTFSRASVLKLNALVLNLCRSIMHSLTRSVSTNSLLNRSMTRNPIVVQDWWVFLHWLTTKHTGISTILKKMQNRNMLTVEKILTT